MKNYVIVILALLLTLSVIKDFQNKKDANERHGLLQGEIKDLKSQIKSLKSEIDYHNNMEVWKKQMNSVSEVKS